MDSEAATLKNPVDLGLQGSSLPDFNKSETSQSGFIETNLPLLSILQLFSIGCPPLPIK